MEDTLAATPSTAGMTATPEDDGEGNADALGHVPSPLPLRHRVRPRFFSLTKLEGGERGHGDLEAPRRPCW